MLKFGRKALLGTAVIAASLTIAAPAQAYYVVAWWNSAIGWSGISYHCDNGTIYYSEGYILDGEPHLVEWAPGQPPC